MTIESRVPRDIYLGLPGINITRLKELRRSPQHYRYALDHPKESDAMTLGIATHVAVLEPERFEKQFAVWTKRTDGGAMSPRRGKDWDEFSLLNASRTILTQDEARISKEIAKAVRSDATAMKYLEAGEPEVTLQWALNPQRSEDNGYRLCKGRIDWFTSDSFTSDPIIAGLKTTRGPIIVGLKTTRDCRPYQFGSQAAKLDYAIQWAWYADGFEANTGKTPRMVEIVVESAPPYAVATYLIEDDLLVQGRENYIALLRQLADCEAADTWPGPVSGERILSLPSWYYPGGDDDLSDLGLEMGS